MNCHGVFISSLTTAVIDHLVNLNLMQKTTRYPGNLKGKKPAPTNDKANAAMLAAMVLNILDALGIKDRKGKTPRELSVEAIARAKVAHAISEGMAGTMANVDAALDALRSGDAETAKTHLERAQKDLITSIAAVHADAARIANAATTPEKN